MKTTSILKKMVSVILCAVLICTTTLLIPADISITGITASADESDPVDSNPDISGTNSMGELFSQALSDEQEKQDESAGNFIYSVNIVDGVACVDYITTENGIITVAIYDETGVQLISSANGKADKESTYTEIELNKEEIPQYFYVRAFLTDEETLRPFCTAYESPNYTQEMQEFFEKTVNDFEEDKIVNFDESESNNFAVYSDETILIDNDGIHNQLIENTEENTYVFKNADETVSSLSTGDIISYGSGNDAVIIKVGSSEKNGSDVIITAQETSMEEVFDYIRIDTVSDFDDITMDTSVMDEGLTFIGVTGSATTSSSAGTSSDKGGISILDVEANIEKKWSFSLKKDLYKDSYDIGDTSVEVSAKISGSVDIGLGAGVKLYLATGGKSYAELKVDYSLNGSVTFSGKASATLSAPVFGISPIPGVFIEIKPSIVVSASGNISASASVSGCVGFQATEKEGFKNISSKPKAKADFKVSASYYVGLSLEPRVKILDDSISYASLKAEAGVEAKVERDLVDVNSSGVLHQCKICDKGTLKIKGGISFELSFAKHPALTFSIEFLTFNRKLWDFYHSHDFEEWGKGECPHKLYRVDISVSGTDPETNSSIDVHDADVTYDYIGYAEKNETSGAGGGSMGGRDDSDPEAGGAGGGSMGGRNGEADPHVDKTAVTGSITAGPTQIFIPGGKYLLAGSHKDYGSGDTIIDVTSPTSATVLLSKNKKIEEDDESQNSGNENTGGENTDNDNDDEWTLGPAQGGEWVDVKCYGSIYGALTSKGDLYLWGTNEGAIGNYGVSGLASYSRVVKTPVRFMDNVKSFDFRFGIAAAITKNNDLYIWGHSDCGALGLGTKNASSDKPVKLMSSVKQVVVSNNYVGAVTLSGDLYMWGDNQKGAIGSRSREYIGLDDSYEATPIKVMSNIKQVYFDYDDTAFAITNDDNLYSWGDNGYFGKTGCGNDTQYVLSPTLILSDVKQIDPSYNGHQSYAVTNNGYLYTWGNQDSWESQDDESINYSPTILMDNVDYIENCYSFTGIVKKNGLLYVIGQRGLGNISKFGQGKDFTWDDLPKPMVPIKVMDNIKSCHFNVHTCVALTNDNKLYWWGNHIYTDDSSYDDKQHYSPTFLFDNVKKYTLNGVACFILTNSGEIYVWGNNQCGEYGNGNYGAMYDESIDYPVKINIPAESSTSTSARSTATVQTTTFDYTDLKPDTVYNFYALKDENADERLSSDNLLYISQGVSDENGELTVSYSLRENVESPALLLVSMEKTDISDAEVTACGYGFDGEEKLVEPTVTIGGEILAQGKDYIITGDYAAADIGTYDYQIVGTGNYKGVLIAQWKITDLNNTSTVISDSVHVGDTVTVTASAGNGSGEYTYLFRYRNAFVESWTQPSEEYSADTSFSFTPDAKGYYDVSVTAKDSEGNIAEKIMQINADVGADDQSSEGKLIVHYYNANNWSTVNMYFYDETVSPTIQYNGAWPGEPMTPEGDNWFRGEINCSGKAMFIANDTSGNQEPGNQKPGYVVEGEAWIRNGTVTEKSRVIVSYTAEDGTVLARAYSDGIPDDESKYNTFVRNIPGYKLISKTDNTSGKYLPGTVNVSYVYRKIEKTDPFQNNSVISKTGLVVGEDASVTAAGEGGTAPYTYEFYYKNSTDDSWIEFGSESSAVFHPESAGSFMIRVYVNDSIGLSLAKDFTVTVTENPSIVIPTDIAISPTSLELTVGESGSLLATVSPSNATNKTITWSSSDPSVASVTETGTVTAVGEGTAAITASTFNGLQATATIYASPEQFQTIEHGIYFEKPSGWSDAYVYFFDKSTDSTVGQPWYGTKMTDIGDGIYCYEYNNTNPNLWLVFNSGNGQQAEIMQYVDCGYYTYDGYQKTIPYQPGIIEVTDVSVSQSSVTVNKGESVTVTASVIPSNATDKTIIWSSSDTSVVTVNGGVITGVAKGTTTITAGSSNGKTATVVVTVKDTDILVNTSTISSETLVLGKKLTITGAAEKGTSPYTYAYYYKRSTNTKWNVIGTEFGTATTATFKPTAAADYDIKVVVKDAAGKTAEKIFKLTVIPGLTNTSWLNAEKVQIGDDIRVTGGAEGGAGGYKYAFYFKRSANSKWNKIGTEFGTKTYGITIPQAAVGYDMKVIVKDSAGNTAEKIFKVTVVESMPLTNISFLSAYDVPVGKTVTAAGRFVGGARPCTYEFYFKRTANTKWNKLSYGSAAGTYAKFTPTAAASYDIKVIAIDSKGTRVSKVMTITAS